MPRSTPPRLINITHTAESTKVLERGPHAGKRHYEVEETNYWAVKTPEDYWDSWNEGETPTEPSSYALTGGAYVIFGGQSVTIYGQEEIDGLRALLDAIEKDLA